MEKIRLAGIVEESIVDGPGIRYVLFTQGCKHNCAGCHNPETHSLDGGYLENIDNIISDIKRNPLLSGVTISGGEPFLQKKALLQLVKRINQTNLNIIVYTGYKIEELLYNEDSIEILKNIDVLIDGKYIEEKKDPLLKFRGSSNQREIDMHEYFKTK